MTTLRVEGVAGEAKEAAERLLAEVFDGIKHGFFNITVEGEIVRGEKRGVTIRAGKSYRFVAHPDDLHKGEYER